VDHITANGVKADLASIEPKGRIVRIFPDRANAANGRCRDRDREGRVRILSYHLYDTFSRPNWLKAKLVR